MAETHISSVKHRLVDGFNGFSRTLPRVSANSPAVHCVVPQARVCGSPKRPYAIEPAFACAVLAACGTGRRPSGRLQGGAPNKHGQRLPRSNSHRSLSTRRYKSSSVKGSYTNFKEKILIFQVKYVTTSGHMHSTPVDELPFFYKRFYYFRGSPHAAWGSHSRVTGVPPSCRPL